VRIVERDGESRNEREVGKKVKRDALTIEFLEDALDGTGAAAAGHLDVELVVMFRHCWGVGYKR
jgi:hypothetical protein